MQTERIHLHDPAGEILCDTGNHNQGVLMLSTHLAVMTTCHKCLGALDLSGTTPITDDEYEALCRRATGTLARAAEPLAEYLAAREQEYRAWVLFGDLLRSLRDSLPWWALVRRRRAAACIAEHEAAYL